MYYYKSIAMFNVFGKKKHWKEERMGRVLKPSKLKHWVSTSLEKNAKELWATQLIPARSNI